MRERARMRYLPLRRVPWMIFRKSDEKENGLILVSTPKGGALDAIQSQIKL